MLLPARNVITKVGSPSKIILLKTKYIYTKLLVMVKELNLIWFGHPKPPSYVKMALKLIKLRITMGRSLTEFTQVASNHW